MMDNNPSKQRLSVIISSDSLCFYYIDSESAKLILSDKVDISIFSETQFVEYLRDLARKTVNARVYLFIDNQEFTLMPTDLFVYGEEEIYLKNVVPPVPNQVFLTDRSSTDTIVNVYRFSKVKIETFERIFPETFKFHLATSLINLAVTKKEILIVYIIGKHFYLALADKKGLKFVNRHPLDKPDDLLYQIQSSLKTYPSEVELLMGGDITKDSQLLRRIQTFYPKMKLYSEDYIENQQLFYKNI